ncbi:MAG: hypothetical protein CMB78_03260 [Euryarchaeota archaeon]|nr:hypothetical protein [Euryarchaeota archaeon]|tara:strand:- start:391 stop:1503 length:1113 start_codon:yes stop_codon:yes gene_type:complete
MTNWEPPRENSIEALRHGIEFSDGVEFDLRMDAEGELVIYHDEFVPGREPIGERCIERLSTSELRSFGIDVFEDLLSDSVFSEAWRKGGKTVDIEIKIPHPMTKIGTDEHLGSMMSKIDSRLKDLELPGRSTLVSSFSPRIGAVSKRSGFGIPVTRLVPHIRAWGRYWNVKRAVAMPNFARTSFQGMAKTLRKEGMESIGIALEYLVGWTKWVNPRMPVGLSGSGLERFQRSRMGMGVIVWPSPLRYEDGLIGAGVTLVSDEMNPTLFSKPDGSARWPRPASQPLDEDWQGRIEGAQSTELPDLISEASSSLPMWHELNDERRKEIVREQAKRMLWPGNAEKWASKTSEGIPWGSPRIIGHRGAGKTHSS